MNGKRLTAQESEQLSVNYERYSAKDLAGLLGRTEISVEQRIKEMRKPPKRVDFDVARMMELAERRRTA